MINLLYSNLHFVILLIVKLFLIKERCCKLVSQQKIAFEINKGNITRITKIIFTGDKKIKEKRLRDIIASEEDKFWKVISKNTRFNDGLIQLDIRYYVFITLNIYELQLIYINYEY